MITEYLVIVGNRGDGRTGNRKNIGGLAYNLPCSGIEP